MTIGPDDSPRPSEDVADTQQRAIEAGKGIILLGEISNGLHEPRVSVLDNKTLIGPEGAQLIRPDSRVVEQLVRESDGKITYFPTPNPEELLEHCGEYVTEPIFSQYLFEGLLRQIEKDLPGKSIALRGVSTSVNGDLPPDETASWINLRDIMEILKVGTEKPGDQFNVMVYNPELGAIGVHRVSQYAGGTGIRRIEANPKQRDAMFPAVIVYDTKSLRKGDGNYGVKFADGVLPSNAVLKVYLLDCTL